MRDPLGRVEAGQVGQRDERGDRLAGTHDDDPLAAGRLVEDLAEALAHLERSVRSHRAMISL